MAKQKIEEQYQKLTDREHVLHRPYMYVGSTTPHTGDHHLYDGTEISYESVTYNPAFLKIFDEILSNSVDEHRKSKSLNEIKVTFNLDAGTIIVWDNGGIPVQKHKVHNEWIPEMIFSNLKAGSSFDDTKDRNTAGTNGVGATLTNIFSNKFTIKTCDGKKRFEQYFTKNMSKRSTPKISDGQRGFTEITYEPDLERFKMKVIDDKTYRILYKRCLDAAACNPRLYIHIHTIKDGKKTINKLKFKKFEEYIKLYTGEREYFYEESKDWKVGFSSSTDGFTNVSFVNSVHTSDGGTHVDYINNQLINHLRAMILKKHKVAVKPSDIRNHLYLFIDCMIVNPAFSSQTKEKLITEHRLFKTTHEVTEKIAKQIFKSEIMESILDWVERKQLAEERLELRKLNKSLDKGRVEKLIDAQKKGDRSKCILGVYEGMSALSAVRKFRNTQMMGAYPLKGKFTNVHELPNSKVIQNDEVKGLMGSLGLKLGEEPKNLRYGKVYIYTDADPDGNSIAAQLMNFFAKYWPELFEQGFIFKVMTPLVVVKKGNKSHTFYTNDEFKEWEVKLTSNIGSWEIEYKKGLAALEDDEYEKIITDPNVVEITYDKEAKNSLEDWFGKDSQPRKDKLLK